MSPATRLRCAFLASIVLSCLLAAGPSASAGLVNRWDLDDGTGSSTAADSAGGKTGTLTNMDPSTDWVAGVSGTALDFDGSDDHVVVTAYKGITGTDARSVSAWINTTSNEGAIVSWGANAGGQKWTFRVQESDGPAGTIRVEVSGGYQVGDTFVADGAWHHVVATWEGDDVLDVRLWVDGVLQGVGASATESINTAATEDVRIAQDFSSRYFDGQMDEVRIYDHALSRQEIAQLSGASADAYWQAVQADSPVAYWRLGEASGTKAFNEGSTGSAVDGTYSPTTGGPTLAQPSLLPTIVNTAVSFDGTDDEVNIPDHDEINTGGPYSQKSIETWFSTDAYTSGDAERVIYEEGGGTHGLNQFVQLDSGTYYVRAGAWHGTDDRHFPARVAIDPGTAYHAVSAYDADNDTFIFYVNGAPVSAKVASAIDPIPAHSDDNAIGGVRGVTRIEGTTPNANSFMGTIDEVALYNSVLDLRAVQTHYAAGTGDRLGIPSGATLGVALNYDAALDTDGNATWEDTVGSRPDDAAVNQFDWALSADVHRVAVSTPKFCSLSQAYVFDGDDTATTRSLNDLATDPSDAPASFEMVFKPDGFSGQEVLFESGGATDGLSIVLDDTVLWFNVKDGGEDARASFDLAGLSAGEQNDFIHMVGVADVDSDQALLYVNGVLRVTQSATDDLVVWGGTNDAGLASVNGAINFGSPSGFAGQIALFRFYPSILSADDVMANYGALIPEPSTLVLLGLGLVGLAVCGRRRRGA